jgi:hypothetical protein
MIGNMPRTSFDALPANARLWIFAAERPLSEQERGYLLNTVDGFLDEWQAHRRPLVSARDFRHDRFLFVGVDESAAGASGCSIDALVRDIKRLESELGLALIDRAPVLYRDGGDILRVPREEFAELARTGRVTPETIVFDNTLTQLGDLQAGRWEVPAQEAWHGRAFF